MRTRVAVIVVLVAGCGKPVAPPPGMVVIPPAPIPAQFRLPQRFGGWSYFRLPGPRSELDAARIRPAEMVTRLGSALHQPSVGWEYARLSGDGSKIVIVGTSVSTRGGLPANFYSVYDAHTLRPIGDPKRGEPDADFRSLRSVSHDGTRVFVRALDKIGYSTRVYEVATGKLLIDVPSRWFEAALSDDGRRVAVGNRFQSVPGDTPMVSAVWDVDAGKEIARVTAVHNEHVSPELSPDGKTLLTTGQHSDPATRLDPKKVSDVTQVWDVETGAELARLNRDTYRRLGPFSPDSKLMVVELRGEDRVGLAELRSGKIVREWSAPRWLTATFRDDGKVLALTGKDCRVRRFDVATGARLGTSGGVPEGVPGDPGLLGTRFLGPDKMLSVA